VTQTRRPLPGAAVIRQYRTGVPIAVAEAHAHAEARGFQGSCVDEVGRLLRALATSLKLGIAGEIGAGFGAGAAWIASGLRPEIPFWTVERDPARANLARYALERHENVTVLTGDWHALLRHAPFDLLFAGDVSNLELEPEALLQLIAPGGIVVLDGLPHRPGTDSQDPDGARDRVRDFWLRDQRVIATELMVQLDHSVLVATRGARSTR
jgi:predicted O-methyltransferase YrrM